MSAQRVFSLRRLGAVVAVVLALVAVGCSSRAQTGSSGGDGGEGGTKVNKIAIATPGKTSDYGWNQQGMQGAKTVAEDVGAELLKATNIGYDKTQSVLGQLAKKDADFIIAHASGYNTIGKRVAQQHNVPTMVVDVPSNVKGLVATLTTSSQEGAYLAGILAAEKTKTDTVGIVISADDTNWFKMSGGFAAGVHSVDPKTEIVFAQIGPAEYADAAGGKRIANKVIAAGADVVFGMGDGATFGYLQAIETADVGHKVWYIGAIGNLSPIDDKDVLLSSVLWTFDGAYKQAVKDIENGTYGTHGYDLSVKNGGISLLQTPHISSSVWQQIQDAKEKIASGEIEVPLTTEKQAVRDLVAGKDS